MISCLTAHRTVEYGTQDKTSQLVEEKNLHKAPTDLKNCIQCNGVSYSFVSYVCLFQCGFKPIHGTKM